MWTKISNLTILSGIKPGHTIAGDPDKPETRYTVLKTTPHYIIAIHNREKKKIVISPQQEIISGNWWLLEE